MGEISSPPVTEQRVRELIREDRTDGCVIRVGYLLGIALAAHFWLSEGGLPGLLHRLLAVLFGQGPS